MINEPDILKVFFEEPLSRHYFREISRKSKGSPNTVQKQIKNILKDKLIVSEGQHGSMKFYTANRESKKFIQLKRIYNIYKLFSSDLANVIASQISPTSVMLFGSYSQGRDTENSDIDIMVLVEKSSKYPAIDLKKFEHILNRKISLHIVQDFFKLSPEFRNNVLNGIVLYGYHKVFNGQNIQGAKRQ